MSDGGERKEEGMRRGNAHANPAWLRAAAQAITKAAREKPFISTNDVHPLIDPSITTHDKRALGSVMRNAAIVGIIEKDTGPQVKCLTPSNHHAPIQVWKSLIYGQGETP